MYIILFIFFMYNFKKIVINIKLKNQNQKFFFIKKN